MPIYNETFSNNIVLIDHNDSFTYNIVALINKVSGQKPDIISIENLDLKLLRKYDKIILSPGSGLPTDYPNSFKIIEKYANTKTILGICLGHQIIGTFYGAKMVNLSQAVHGQKKRIKVKNNFSLFAKLPKEFLVGLYHSWVLSLENLPETLQSIALSEDNLIMAIKHRHKSVYGIQFHPESFLTEIGEKLMQNFLQLS